MFFADKKLETLNNFSDSESITSIGIDSFTYCHSLTNVKLPGSLKTINHKAFRSCKNLNSIVFPEGITSLPADIFSFDNSIGSDSLLSYVYIPASVTHIDDDALLTINRNSSAVKSYIPMIYGHNGSAAQTYATAHGISFVDVDSKLADVK